MDHIEAIERLVARGHTIAGLERVLRLSPNYLSKVRHRAVKPSFQLAALLTIIESHPEVLATIGAAPTPTEPPAPSAPTRHPPALDLLGLIPMLDDLGVRYAVLGSEAHVDDGVSELELDLVVHDADRHVLPALRDRGVLCSHHSSTLFRVRRLDAAVDDAFSLHFPVAPPLAQAISTVTRKTIRGVDAPVVSALNTALYFVLNRREDGLTKVRALTAGGAVDRSAIERALEALSGLPPTRSPYVLQTFDRELAAERMKEL